MNYLKSRIFILPFLILLFAAVSLLSTGCKKSNFKRLNGKAYLYKDSVYEFTAEFDKDTLYYIMKDERRPFFHKSKFSVTKIDDTTFTLKLEKKPPFWTKETWDIIVKENEQGFRSKESGNYYNLYVDSLIVKYVF